MFRSVHPGRRIALRAETARSTPAIEFHHLPTLHNHAVGSMYDHVRTLVTASSLSAQIPFLQRRQLGVHEVRTRWLPLSIHAYTALLLAGTETTHPRDSARRMKQCRSYSTPRRQATRKTPSASCPWPVTGEHALPDNLKASPRLTSSRPTAHKSSQRLRKISARFSPR